jgi:hypothetical protein
MDVEGWHHGERFIMTLMTGDSWCARIVLAEGGTRIKVVVEINSHLAAAIRFLFTVMMTKSNPFRLSANENCFHISPRLAYEHLLNLNLSENCFLR